jgi:hypothetical protein
MHDPLESVTASGTIRTGASSDRIPAAFRPVLKEAVAAVREADHRASLYVYGSVATGTARLRHSDVDLLSIGLPAEAAAGISEALSAAYSGLCRAVAIAAARGSDFSGETDAAHGGRVFLKHYCVHLTGPDLHSDFPESAADVAAARGFNGDIGQHARRWRTELDAGTDTARLSRRLARKTLLAVAGLVSVADGTWTTDRAAAAARWSEIEPDLAGDLRMLLAWSDGDVVSDAAAIEAALDGVVARITNAFGASIGLWAEQGP